MGKLKISRFIIMVLFVLVSVSVPARTVRYVDIQASGLYDEEQNDKNDEKECQVFQPTRQQILEFFNDAKETEESGNLLHEYYSPCLAKGIIIFKDGAYGKWIIQSSGLGYVTFDNNLTRWFFHKNNNWFDPYACNYGLSDELTC